MLRDEFEQRTGIYPTNSLYQVIEKHYLVFDGDKDEFCAAYRENRENLAAKIQNDADLQEVRETNAVGKLKEDYERQIAKLNGKLEQVTSELDKELEWRPYEIPENVSQADYNKLIETSVTTKWEDHEAIDFLSRELGFAKDRIRIIKSIPVFEINRHQRYRKAGTSERLPLYAASDWNYIRFNCAGREYEYHNGEFRKFYQ